MRRNVPIVYLTNRLNPRFKWFFDSLDRELEGNYAGVQIIIVDFFAHDEDRIMGVHAQFHKPGMDLKHVPPKPNVWQGPHRLTTQDYFAASNARNTGICHAKHGYIAFADDLSILMPGWWNRIQWGAENGFLLLGTYCKVKDMKVTKGRFKSGDMIPSGEDPRVRYLKGQGADLTKPFLTRASLLYGCSFAAPTDKILQTGGFDEDCDSMGTEDSIFGVMMEHTFTPTYFCHDMMTYESEEGHSDNVLLRIAKPTGRRDAVWTMLDMVTSGDRKIAPNYFPGGVGIAGTRDRILAGQDFEVCKIPEHDWRDGQPLSEM